MKKLGLHMAFVIQLDFKTLCFFVCFIRQNVMFALVLNHKRFLFPYIIWLHHHAYATRFKR